MRWPRSWMNTLITELLNKKPKFYNLSCLPSLLSHMPEKYSFKIYSFRKCVLSFSLPFLMELTYFSSQTELVPLAAHMLLVLLLEEFTFFDPSKGGNVSTLRQGACCRNEAVPFAVECCIQLFVYCSPVSEQRGWQEMVSAGSGKNCIFKRQWWLLSWKREEISHYFSHLFLC